MAQKDTVERILDAAEHLFSEKGFAETSLRNITTRASVNLAAVNYHFGSKKSLIQAVFARYLDPLTLQLQKDVEQLKQDQPNASLEQLLQLLLFSIARTGIKGDNLSLVMRLLGLAYMQGQGHLRKFLRDEYGQSYQVFVDHLNDITPELSEQERFWRVHFALGAVVFSMSSLSSLQAIEKHDYGSVMNIDQIVQQLKSFIASGIQQSGLAPAIGRE